MNKSRGRVFLLVFERALVRKPLDESVGVDNGVWVSLGLVWKVRLTPPPPLLSPVWNPPLNPGWTPLPKLTRFDCLCEKIEL